MFGGEEGGPDVFADVETTVVVRTTAVITDPTAAAKFYPYLVGSTSVHRCADRVVFRSDRLDGAPAEILSAAGLDRRRNLRFECLQKCH